MENWKDRFDGELKELRKIFYALDEINQKKLEELIIMLKTKFSERIEK